jgi:uncharacterized protein (TIGR02646 family)
MRRITKGNTPAALNRWVRRQEGVNCSYREMPADVKGEVKRRLMREQGNLCCYTGIRIAPGKCHIEHLMPQRMCTAGREDVDYNNLLAAYPGESTRRREPRCPFGAHEKGDWYDERMFVHPLLPDCEHRFVFDLNGDIKPRRADDEAAVETIRRLKLDHGRLVDLRRERIEETFFTTRMSEAQVRQLRDSVYQKDREGRYREFCFMIFQACELYLRKLERSRARRVAINRQRG